MFQNFFWWRTKSSPQKTFSAALCWFSCIQARQQTFFSSVETHNLALHFNSLSYWNIHLVQSFWRLGVNYQPLLLHIHRRLRCQSLSSPNTFLHSHSSRSSNSHLPGICINTGSPRQGQTQRGWFHLNLICLLYLQYRSCFYAMSECRRNSSSKYLR